MLASYARTADLFQFLLGTLKTHHHHYHPLLGTGFQFLLGTLKTHPNGRRECHVGLVSIPLRYAKNDERRMGGPGFMGVSIPLRYAKNDEAELEKACNQ